MSRHKSFTFAICVAAMLCTSTSYAGWGHGGYGGWGRVSGTVRSYTPYRSSNNYTRKSYSSSPSYSTPSYSTSPSYSTPSYSTPSYSSPSYSSSPTYHDTHSTYKASSPAPIIVHKAPHHSAPVKHLEIRIICPDHERGECAYTLISARGTPFDYSITAGKKQTIVVKKGWKIKFRPERGQDWVGYNLTPGHSYALQRDEDGFWDLYEM